MDIHKFEKAWLVASLLLIVGFIVTITYGAVGAGVAMVDDSGGTIDSTTPTDSPEFRDPGVYETGDRQYDVYVVARQFQFDPGTDEPIRVPAGSTVTFHLASADVIHGFELAGTNVNIMVIPGQIATATVEFEDEATYGMLCNEYCGAAHHSMEGQLHVVAPESYESETRQRVQPDEDATQRGGERA